MSESIIDKYAKDIKDIDMTNGNDLGNLLAGMMSDVKNIIETPSEDDFQSKVSKLLGSTQAAPAILENSIEIKIYMAEQLKTKTLVESILATKEKFNICDNAKMEFKMTITF